MKNTPYGVGPLPRPPEKPPARRKKAIALQKALERKLRRVVETVPGTPHVRVTITRFTPGKGGRAPTVAYRLSLVGKNDRVRLDTSVNPPRLLVWKGGPLNIRFTLAAAGTTRALYYPFGIALAYTGTINPYQAPRRGVLGHETFPPGSHHIYGTSLFLTDNYGLDSRGDVYEYTLLVQDAKSGQVGVIDPGLVHIPPMAP
ncbi:MAG TPA: hypothetical protein VGF85_08595 [Opitutaceae bacterium]|jgi:hypothetical protein